MVPSVSSTLTPRSPPPFPRPPFAGDVYAVPRDGPLSLAAFDVGVGELRLRRQLRTTHRRVWAGSQCMLPYLLHNHYEALQKPGIRILELGAGSGWLGLNLAAALPLAVLVLSEHPDALPNLRQHIQRVSEVLPNVYSRVSTIQLEWGADDALNFARSNDPFDFVVAADVIYSLPTLSLLPPLMQALLERGGVQVLLEYTPGRKKEVDAALESCFLESGLLLSEESNSGQDDEQQQATEEHGEIFAAACACTNDTDDDSESMPWLVNGGLFAAEDEAARRNRPPSFRIFRVVR